MNRYFLLAVISLFLSLFCSYILKAYFEMPIESTFSGIATVGVIIITFYTYEDQKKEKKRIDSEEEKNRTTTRQRDSAKLVVMQIDRADAVMKSAKKNGFISATLPKFIGESEWDKSKHILVDRLSSTDLDFINSYFIACEQLEESRSIVVNLEAEQLNEKARCIQRVLSTKVASEIEKNSPTDETKNNLFSFSDQLRNFYINLDYGQYNPNYQKLFFAQVLNENDTNIKGTTAYKALRAIAEMS